MKYVRSYIVRMAQYLKEHSGITSVYFYIAGVLYGQKYAGVTSNTSDSTPHYTQNLGMEKSTSGFQTEEQRQKCKQISGHKIMHVLVHI